MGRRPGLCAIPVRTRPSPSVCACVTRPSSRGSVCATKRECVRHRTKQLESVQHQAMPGCAAGRYRSGHMRCEVRTDPTIQTGIRLAGRQDGATPAWPVPVEVRVPPGYSQPTFTRGLLGTSFPGTQYIYCVFTQYIFSSLPKYIVLIPNIFHSGNQNI